MFLASSSAPGNFSRSIKYSAEVANDDELSEAAFGSVYGEDVYEYDQEALEPETVTGEEMYAAEDYVRYYGDSEERMDYDQTLRYTEVFESGPPPCEDSGAYVGARMPPGEVYTGYMPLVQDDYADENIEMVEDIPWSSDARLDHEEDAAEVYANVLEADPPVSEEAGSTMDSGEISLLSAAPASFSEKRLTLLRGRVETGWAGIAQENVVRYPTVSSVEDDVAKGLRNHWLPQRL